MLDEEPYWRPVVFPSGGAAGYQGAALLRNRRNDLDFALSVPAHLTSGIETICIALSAHLRLPGGMAPHDLDVWDLASIWFSFITSYSQSSIVSPNVCAFCRHEQNVKPTISSLKVLRGKPGKRAIVVPFENQHLTFGAQPVWRLISAMESHKEWKTDADMIADIFSHDASITRDFVNYETLSRKELMSVLEWGDSSLPRNIISNWRSRPAWGVVTENGWVWKCDKCKNENDVIVFDPLANSHPFVPPEENTQQTQNYIKNLAYYLAIGIIKSPSYGNLPSDYVTDLLDEAGKIALQLRYNQKVDGGMVDIERLGGFSGVFGPSPASE